LDVVLNGKKDETGETVVRLKENGAKDKSETGKNLRSWQ
jgi:hypothetical protein